MESIIIDFKKTFTTITNHNNNENHLLALNNLVNNFEKKYISKYEISTLYMCSFLKNELDILNNKFYGCTQN